MKTGKVIIATISSGVLLAVALTGCVSTATKIQPTKSANPNHVTTDNSVISLLETPSITKLPKFDLTVKLPDGWTLDPYQADKVDGEKAKLPSALASFNANNSDKTCNLQGSVNSTDSYKAGRGDLYLSKEFLYTTLSLNNALPSNESTFNIPFGDKKLTFVTGHYSTVMHMPNIDPSGKNLGGTRDVEQAAYIADRAIDKLFPNSNTIPNQFGTDPGMGIPIIQFKYTCNDPKQLDGKTFDALMGAVKLTNEG